MKLFNTFIILTFLLNLLLGYQILQAIKAKPTTDNDIQVLSVGTFDFFDKGDLSGLLKEVVIKKWGVYYYCIFNLGGNQSINKCQEITGFEFKPAGQGLLEIPKGNIKKTN